MNEPPGLLVSVRSVAEAHAALAGGASLIDVKEPLHGSLGRAPADVITGVVTTVAGRRPVSAALGELLEELGETIPPGLAFVKWGLAGCGQDREWRARLVRRQCDIHGMSMGARSASEERPSLALRALIDPLATREAGPDAARVSQSDSGGTSCTCPKTPGKLEILPAQTVTVAYADWQCARAPSVEEVAAFALTQPGGVLLVDTHCKDAPNRGGSPPTLLDWLSRADIESLCERCRAGKVCVALAGSLGPKEISELLPAQPDWFAVRGAACEAGRYGEISTERVRMLVQLINQGRARPRAG
jgi:uncharacterized protein (UPF0264 family)